MKTPRARSVLLLAALLLAAGCGAKEEAQTTQAGPPPIAVEVTPVKAGDLVSGVDVVGTLVAKNEASIKSEVGGIVTDVYVTEWVPLKKGTPLARLDSREADATLMRAAAAVEAARANVLQAEVNQARAVREYNRLVSLKNDGLATQQSLDEAETARDAAVAAVAAARAQLAAAENERAATATRASKTVIRAPFDGVVSKRSCDVGMVPGDKELFHMVDNRQLELTVTVPAREMNRLALGQPIVFTVDSLPGDSFIGRVKFINPAVNQTDRSISVLLHVPNESGPLKSGLFVKGRILTEQRTGVLLVPRTALMNWSLDKGTAEVYLAQSGKAKRQAIKTGAVSGEMVEVTEGLKPGDPLITRGGFNLHDDDPVNVVSSPGAPSIAADTEAR